MLSNLKFAIKKIIACMASLLIPTNVMRTKSFFPLWEDKGYHVTPVHFYEPIPDTRTLRNDLWQKKSELVGIDLNEEYQIKLLSLFSSKFKEEYEKFPRSKTSVPYEYYVNNGGFESVDGEVLYCMIRHFKPNKIFEIGAGNSTYLCAQAILENQKDINYECELVAFEPYPNDILKGGYPGLSKLISAEIQNISLDEFDTLGRNDILFIDSTHVLNIGSDVQYEYLEILPRLNVGVIVHLHDIFLPAEYPKDWVLHDYKFWTEQYLLQAFLTFNDSYEVLLANCYMHLNHPDKLESAFSTYNRVERWPGSFWIRKIK